MVHDIPLACSHDTAASLSAHFYFYCSGGLVDRPEDESQSSTTSRREGLQHSVRGLAKIWAHRNRPQRSERVQYVISGARPVNRLPKQRRRHRVRRHWHRLPHLSVPRAARALQRRRLRVGHVVLPTARLKAPTRRALCDVFCPAVRDLARSLLQRALRSMAF